MNTRRRKTLQAIIDRLGDLNNMRVKIREQLQEVMDEEQGAFDNMPESLQNGDKGQQMLEHIDAIQDVIGELDLMFIDSLQAQISEMIEA